MSLKKIVCIILVVLICLLLHNMLKQSQRESFDSHDSSKCYSGCRDRQIASLTDVCPDKPECVGICINQHTYTEENIVNDPLKTLEDVGTLKNGQTKADVISTNCGLCIDNFYAGLKNMNDLGSRCSQN